MVYRLSNFKLVRMLLENPAKTQLIMAHIRQGWRKPDEIRNHGHWEMWVLRWANVYWGSGAAAGEKAVD
jgi:hypothetical protein